MIRFKAIKKDKDLHLKHISDVIEIKIKLFKNIFIKKIFNVIEMNWNYFSLLRANRNLSQAEFDVETFCNVQCFLFQLMLSYAKRNIVEIFHNNFSSLRQKPNNFPNNFPRHIRYEISFIKQPSRLWSLRTLKMWVDGIKTVLYCCETSHY